MALEDLFREAAAKGLTHFSLSPTTRMDGKTVYWNARATPSTGHSYVQAANEDPVRAAELVLEALPRAKRRKIEFTPEENAMKLTNGDLRVTAAVKEPAATLDPELENWLPKP